MPPVTPACVDCKFYLLSLDGYGICRRFPPALYPCAPHALATSENVWPIVNPAQWCGEWQHS